ncbi:MAG: iron chaperone [Candidatus Acidiferrales bacterium]
MKKANSRNRSAASQGNNFAKSVEEYLARVPEPARSTLKKIRTSIRSAVPAEATEGISYGIPVFKYHGSLVWFAAFADHCSLFPTASVIETFKNELKGFSTSKGTIHFPTDKPLPSALVRKMVKARVAQIRQKKQR